MELSPYLLRHYTQRYEHNGSHNCPDYFQSIIAVRVCSPLALFPGSKSKENISKCHLRQNKSNPHHDKRSRELRVNRVSHHIDRMWRRPEILNNKNHSEDC